MQHVALIAGLLALLLPFGGAAAAESRQPPVVAAAADLQFALQEVARHFSAESGVAVRLVFGSSGNLSRQIADGAPFDLFMSADESYVERLVRAGLTRDGGALYAIGRLVVFVPHGSPVIADERLDGVRAWLERTPAAARFAMANPEHAPYGRAAEAVLRGAGLWERIASRLVLGENVAQAAQFATTGGAAGGIVAYSLVLAPPMRGLGTYALIPDVLHPPLRQRMVLLNRADGAAARFYEYLQAAAARELLRQYGFALPDE